MKRLLVVEKHKVHMLNSEHTHCHAITMVAIISQYAIARFMKANIWYTSESLVLGWTLSPNSS